MSSHTPTKEVMLDGKRYLLTGRVNIEAYEVLWDIFCKTIDKQERALVRLKKVIDREVEKKWT